MSARLTRSRFKQGTAGKFGGRVYVLMSGHWHIGTGFGITRCGLPMAAAGGWRQLIRPAPGAVCPTCDREAGDDDD